MDESYTPKEKLTGLFLFFVLIISLLALLVIGQGKAWFKAQRTYLVKFPQGYNLTQGAAVKMFNADVGKVTRIRITRVGGDNQVEITIKVLAEYADLIRQDSVAQVESPTIFGSEYISISPGSPGYPPIAEYGAIPSRVRKTLADYLEELKPEETLARLRQIVENLANLSSQFKNYEKKLASTLDHIDKVVVSVTDAKGTVGKLLMKPDIYNRLDKSLVRLDAFLKDSQTAAGDVKTATAQLPGLVSTVGQELDKVKAILSDIQTGLQEFPGLMESAADATQSGKEVMDAVKANPLIKLTLPKAPAGRSVYVEPRSVP